MLLPDASIAEAAALAERMRQALITHVWPDPPGEQQSASFGVAAADADSTLDELILRADRALLVAKSSGRDRIVVDPGRPAGATGTLPPSVG